jgi:RNA polymerase sigma factor (sigma-70 family)
MIMAKTFPMKTDCELLRRFIEQGEEAAFAEVVRRQTNLVYSVALRVSRNPQIAEEVTQGVFTKLARQARLLCRHDSLVGWLHLMARHRAIDAIRGEERRRAREQEAVTMHHDPTTPAANWAGIAPLLDEAVERLGERDRQAVLLRYFNGLSHREVGATLGLSENAANKRVERALEKLRGYFASRGVKASSALLATAIAVNSVQAAPVGLAERVTPISLAGAGGTLNGGAFLAAFFSFFMNATTKSILAAVILILLALVLATEWQSSNGQSLSTGAVKPARALDATSEPPPAESTGMEPPPADSTVTSDPRVEVNTAMEDFAGLLESGDYATAVGTYMQIPPNMTGQQVVEALQKNPDFSNTIKMMIDATKAAQAETPDYDDTGDLATYTLSQPTDGKTMVRWKNIDGIWYVDAFE